MGSYVAVGKKLKTVKWHQSVPLSVPHTVLEIRIRNWSAVLKIGYFMGLLIAVPLKMYRKIWPTKMDFGQPNA